MHMLCNPCAEKKGELRTEHLHVTNRGKHILTLIVMTYLTKKISHAVSRADVEKTFKLICIVLIIAVAVLVIGIYWSNVEQKESQIADKSERINFALHFVKLKICSCGFHYQLQ